MTKTILGDHIPSANDWVLLFVGKTTMGNEEFRDVVSWEIVEWGDNPSLEVVYRSGREEVYIFSHECVAGGMLVIDPREEAMRAWDGEREQPKF